MKFIGAILLACVVVIASLAQVQDIRRAALPPQSSTPAASGAITNILTNGVSVGAADSVDFVSGVTGYVSGSTAMLGVSVAGGGAGLSTNENQFGASDVLTIKDGAMFTNINSYGSGITMVGGDPTLYQSATDGSLRFGVTPGNSGPQFQLFGPDHAQLGNSYFDGGIGSMFFRFNNQGAAVILPGASSVVQLNGFDVDETPVNTAAPVIWMKVQVENGIYFVPLYQ